MAFDFRNPRSGWPPAARAQYKLLVAFFSFQLLRSWQKEEAATRLVDASLLYGPARFGYFLTPSGFGAL